MLIKDKPTSDGNQPVSIEADAQAARCRALIVDLVSEVDRIFFEDHPSASEYTRTHVQGEAGVEINAVATVVRQLRPGQETRVYAAQSESWLYVLPNAYPRAAASLQGRAD